MFGIEKFLPADVLLTHVDFSLVPEEYIEFSRRFPCSLNSHITDIRKSSICPHLITRQDPYSGPVIVKTNLNYCGIPERIHAIGKKFRIGPRLSGYTNRILNLASGLSSGMRTKLDYLVFESRDDVPECYFGDEFVIQKFLPEKLGTEYILREYYFLNDAELHTVEAGSNAVLTTGSRMIKAFHHPTPSCLTRLRESSGIDYGKIDYAMVNGKAVVFDVNKTVGIRRTPTKNTWLVARTLASGIETQVNQDPERNR